jgi:hypothetical protein
MQIHISAGSSQSIYRQIADQIRQAIVSGNLKIGDAVPSVRQLAKELAINPNTVAKAYSVAAWWPVERMSLVKPNGFVDWIWFWILS